MRCDAAAITQVGCLLATSVPNFALVVTLVGSICTMLISFILPAYFYLASHAGQLSTGMQLLNGGIVLVGFVGMFFGVAGALSSNQA